MIGPFRESIRHISPLYMVQLNHILNELTIFSENFQKEILNIRLACSRIELILENL